MNKYLVCEKIEKYEYYYAGVDFAPLVRIMPESITAIKVTT